MKPDTLKKLFVIATQHLDVAWLWNRRGHGEELQKMVFEMALDLAENHEDTSFLLSRSTAWGYAVIEKKWPLLFAKIKEAVAHGRIELAGGQWVEPDNLIPSGESLIRQSLYGQHYFLTRFGKTAKVSWNPDVFGHGNTLPQIFQQSGLPGYYFHRVGPSDPQGKPISQFVWESPDGSQVLCFTGNWKGAPDIGAAESLFDTTATSGLPADFLVTGVGSDRRMTIRESWLAMPGLVGEATGLDVCQWSGAEDMLAEMETYRDTLPVVTGDLGGYMFTGTYTSDQITKRYNRRLENDLATSEMINTWAYVQGGSYNAGLISRAWRNLCLNQFHDIICGTCYKSAQDEAHELYREVDSDVYSSLDIAVEELVEGIRTDDQPGAPLVVFNPISGPGIGPVTIELVDCGPVRIVTADGDPVPSQRIVAGERHYVTFAPGRLPALGASVYYLQPEDEELIVRDELLVLENDYVRVTIDSSYGSISSFYDKRQGFEYIKPENRANKIVVYEDRNTYPHSADHRWDPWFIKLTGEIHDPHGAYTVGVTESGPVRKTIQVARSLQVSPGCSETVIIQEISLYHDSPLLHVHMYGDWQASQATVRSEFGLSLSKPIVACDMPYGVIERPVSYQYRSQIGEEAVEDNVEKGSEREEPDRPMQMWLDVSDGTRGMAFLNNGKYGYCSDENSISLTLMRAPLIRDNEVAGLGPFDFSYALYAHPGTWKEAGIPSLAFAFNRPPVARVSYPGRGAIASGTSLFSVNDPSVLIAAVKRSEQGGSVVIRLFQSTGEPRDIEVRSCYAFKNPRITNALEIESEQDTRRLEQTADGTIRLSIRAYEILTIKLEVEGANNPV